MGINVNYYKILGDVAKIESPYLRVRDIKVTKISTNIFEYTYKLEILLNGAEVHSERNLFVKPNVSDLSNWKLAYDHLKAELTKRGITFTDNI